MLPEVVGDLRAAWADIMKRAGSTSTTTSRANSCPCATTTHPEAPERRALHGVHGASANAPPAVVVVHFIAMLELARESLLEITQAEPYAPIYVRLAYERGRRRGLIRRRAAPPEFLESRPHHPGTARPAARPEPRLRCPPWATCTKATCPDEDGQHGDPVVASIFVNRLQFGPEDFDRYPTLAPTSRRWSASATSTMLFAPDEREMYPEPQNYACAARRPGRHSGRRVPARFFTGVSTVVLKLFPACSRAWPCSARRTTSSSWWCATCAASSSCRWKCWRTRPCAPTTTPGAVSRNRYLSDAERAPRRRRCRRAARHRAAAGRRRDRRPRWRPRPPSLARRGWLVDYISVRRQRDLASRGRRPGRRRTAGGAGRRQLGATRLIDNLELAYRV